jgi:AraC-like DNA-binding protein
MLLTMTQALQLVGITPSLFVIFFLMILSVRNRQAVIPIFYFSALICSFSLPLLEVYTPQMRNRWVEAGLLLGDSTLTAFSFLLICQFIIGRVPPFWYWLVLAIPLLGGSSLIYADMLQVKYACTRDQACPDVQTINTLYHVFSSSVIFLLLVYYISRAGGLHGDDIVKRHKYWLVIALILLHLLVLAVDLARMSGHFTQEQGILISTMLRLTFIYLVLTSLFRVFYPGFIGFSAPQGTDEETFDPAQDMPIVEKVRMLLEGERVYRQMRLNRARLAELAGTSEYNLSRIINRHFGMNFNELINSYRIEEAKSRLRNESGQITVIGFEVGFNSIASFNRVFRSKVGASPTEYRNTARVG